jgi:hypothetical protein
MDRLSAVIPAVMRAAAAQRKEYGVQGPVHLMKGTAMARSSTSSSSSAKGQEEEEEAEASSGRSRITEREGEEARRRKEEGRRSSSDPPAQRWRQSSSISSRIHGDAAIRQTLIRQAFVPLY